MCELSSIFAIPKCLKSDSCVKKMGRIRFQYFKDPQKRPSFYRWEKQKKGVQTGKALLKHNPGHCLIETCVHFILSAIANSLQTGCYSVTFPFVRIQTAFQVLEWFFPGDMAAWTCHMSGNANVFVRKNVAKKAPNRSFADETNFYIFVQRVPDCCPPGLGLALGLSSRKDALCHLPALHGFDTMLCPALEVGGL